jgi:hypothetical protein
MEGGLVEAFRRYGAKLVNPQWAVTAIAEDGALVVSCWSHYFTRPSPDVMRYEDRLSRWEHNVHGTNLARRHLAQAVEERLPVRLIIGTASKTAPIDKGESASHTPKKYHVREDLAGRVVEFDGERFVIEFKR